MSAPPIASTFVPADLNGADWAAVEPLLRSLLERPINSAADLEKWLVDRGELDAAISESLADLYIATTCDTDDAAAEAAYARFVEEVSPRIKPMAFELDRRFVAMAERFALPRPRYLVLERAKRAAVELFREDNIPIQTELAMLAQEHGKITGSQTVNFDGAERPLPQMARYLERTDRVVREAAWRAVAERRLRDRDALDDLLDRMIVRRTRLAANAGCAGFVEYAFREKLRFDYTPQDCARFWDSIERRVVPLVRRQDERRREALGVTRLRPWDLAVDPSGRPPLRPFDGGRELARKTHSAVASLDQRLGSMFETMSGALRDGAPGSPMRTEFLDLDSRKGKRPGGYQYQRDRSRRPFIFMNAAGVHQDVMTMVHEAGHAFHSILSSHDPLADYRDSPTEFAEVASMSMEFLTMPHWGGANGFYPDEADRRRAAADHLRDSVTILPWIATIDAFQHWLYRHPTHDRRERQTYWLGLDARFGRAVDWSGLAQERSASWQRQGHLFSHPMYYIEYGIAQLGAMQLWLKSRREGEAAAIGAYIAGLSLGSSRPLPELFRAAGIQFDFGEDTIARLVESVESELDAAAGGL